MVLHKEDGVPITLAEWTKVATDAATSVETIKDARENMMSKADGAALSAKIDYVIDALQKFECMKRGCVNSDRVMALERFVTLCKWAGGIMLGVIGSVLYITFDNVMGFIKDKLH